MIVVENFLVFWTSTVYEKSMRDTSPDTGSSKSMHHVGPACMRALSASFATRSASDRYVCFTVRKFRYCAPFSYTTRPHPRLIKSRGRVCRVGPSDFLVSGPLVRGRRRVERPHFAFNAQALSSTCCWTWALGRSRAQICGRVREIYRLWAECKC